MGRYRIKTCTDRRADSMRLGRDNWREGIEEVRHVCGLRSIKRGVIPCMSCDRKFKSADVIANRLCEKCIEAAAREEM